MNNAVGELLDFFQGGEPGSALGNVISALGHEDVRILSIKIFRWLKEQRRSRREKPLEYRSEYHWCRDIVTALQLWNGFADLFVMSSEGLTFSMAISSEERNAIREFVAREYQPTLRK